MDTKLLDLIAAVIACREKRATSGPDGNFRAPSGLVVNQLAGDAVERQPGGFVQVDQA